jgi:hypothetical protein
LSHTDNVFQIALNFRFRKLMTGLGRICTVTQQSQHIFFSQLGDLSDIRFHVANRLEIQLEIARMNNRADRCMDNYAKGTRDIMTDTKKFNFKPADCDNIFITDRVQIFRFV